MYKYLLRVANAKMIVKGYNEYSAIISTGLFEDADMIACVCEDKHIYLFTVKLNDSDTMAFIKRI